jgi:hypothetical protein
LIASAQLIKALGGGWHNQELSAYDAPVTNYRASQRKGEGH